MCNTTVLKAIPDNKIHRPLIPKSANSKASILGRKRSRHSDTTPSACSREDSHVGDPVARRPSKRVSFCNRDTVLGRAQAYDRTSSLDPLPFVSGISQTAPRRTVGTTPNAAGDDTDSSATRKANFCGIWRRSHGFNWAALLELSGVDKAVVPVQAAKMQSASVLHLIDHDETSFRLIVHSDSGSTQDQNFVIGGQPRPNIAATSASSTTVANMRWAKNGQALVLTSVDAATGDEMTVSRHLASQGSVMVQHYRARRAQTGQSAEAITIFRRMVRRVDVAQ